jgi:hypothetical protein
MDGVVRVLFQLFGEAIDGRTPTEKQQARASFGRVSLRCVGAFY